MADTPVRVDVILTDEEYRRLAAAVEARGRPAPDGFAWLIAEGLVYYRTDQEAWVAGPPGEADVRELQRREARAHLLLMRTRAAQLDARVAELRATVAALSPRYQQLRAALFALQRERRAHEAPAQAVAADPQPSRPALVVRLRGLLRAIRRRW